jgi:hypothetical protein
MRHHADRQLEHLRRIVDLEIGSLLRDDPAGHPLRADDHERERSLLAAPVMETTGQPSLRRVIETLAAQRRMD